jgi:hypothetical protein
MHLEVSMRNKSYVRLEVEALESRLTPAYMSYSPGNFLLLIQNDPAGGDYIVRDWGPDPRSGFSLTASVVTTSDRYAANGYWQAVKSTPDPFEPIASPTQDEWRLISGQFPLLLFSQSEQSLADDSLIIRDAEALGPSRQPAGAPMKVGQSLFVQYSPSGRDPSSDDIHWLQFATASYSSQVVGGAPDNQLMIDGGTSDAPFYDLTASANESGFADIPSTLIRPGLISFHADLFLVQDIDIGIGYRSEVVWQGIRWGWETGRAAPRVSGIGLNSGPSGGGYTLTVTGDSFIDATSVSFGNVPATSFTVNSDTSITATVPGQPIGTSVDVTVTSPAGTSDTSTADHFIYVNGAPIGTNKTIATTENNSYTLGVGDFGFTDPTDYVPGNLQAVEITSLPTHGSLTLDGSAVSPGEVISVLDINAGKLVFAPDANAFGIPYASFAFQVQDDGGTANGGLDTDPNAKTMTVNVYAPPTLSKIAEYAVTEGDTLQTSAFGSDPQGLALTYGLVNAPPGASIDAASGMITFLSADDPDVPTVAITVQVTNAAGLSASTTFHVNVNDPPPAAAGIFANMLIVAIGESVTFTVVNPHDPAGIDPPSSFTYQWTVDSGTPVTTSSPSYTTSFSTSGMHQITVRIIDDDGAYSDYMTWITVTGGSGGP